MGLDCMINGCYGRHNARGTVSVHAFPKEKHLCDEWEKFVRKMNPAFVHKPGSRYGICSKHFDEKYFRNLGQFQLGYATVLHLLKDAIPTKYPDVVIKDSEADVANVPQLFQNPETMADLDKKNYGPRKYNRVFVKKRPSPISPVMTLPKKKVVIDNPGLLKKIIGQNTKLQISMVPNPKLPNSKLKESKPPNLKLSLEKPNPPVSKAPIPKLTKPQNPKLQKILPKPTCTQSTQSTSSPVLRVLYPKGNASKASKMTRKGPGKRKSIEHVAMLIRLRNEIRTTQNPTVTPHVVPQAAKSVKLSQAGINGTANGYQLLPLDNSAAANIASGSTGRTWVLLPEPNGSSAPVLQTGSSSRKDSDSESVGGIEKLDPVQEYYRETLLAMYDMQRKNILCDLILHVPGSATGNSKKDVGISIHKSLFATVSKKIHNFKQGIMHLNRTCRTVSVLRVVEFVYTGEIKSLQSLKKWTVVSIYVAAVSMGVSSCVAYLQERMPGISFPESYVQAMLAAEQEEVNEICASLTTHSQKPQKRRGEMIETEIITDIENNVEYLENGYSGSVIAGPVVIAKVQVPGRGLKRSSSETDSVPSVDSENDFGVSKQETVKKSAKIDAMSKPIVGQNFTEHEVHCDALHKTYLDETNGLVLPDAMEQISAQHEKSLGLPRENAKSFAETEAQNGGSSMIASKEVDSPKQREAPPELPHESGTHSGEPSPQIGASVPAVSDDQCPMQHETTSEFFTEKVTNKKNNPCVPVPEKQVCVQHKALPEQHVKTTTNFVKTTGNPQNDCTSVPIVSEDKICEKQETSPFLPRKVPTNSSATTAQNGSAFVPLSQKGQSLAELETTRMPHLKNATNSIETNARNGSDSLPIAPDGHQPQHETVPEPDQNPTNSSETGPPSGDPCGPSVPEGQNCAQHETSLEVLKTGSGKRNAQDDNQSEVQALPELRDVNAMRGDETYVEIDGVSMLAVSEEQNASRQEMLPDKNPIASEKTGDNKMQDVNFGATEYDTDKALSSEQFEMLSNCWELQVTEAPHARQETVFVNESRDKINNECIYIELEVSDMSGNESSDQFSDEDYASDS